MKSLVEFLSTDVDKTKIYKFPETPIKEELIEYFEAMGFLQLDPLPVNKSTWPCYCDIAEEQDGQFYILGSYEPKNRYSHFIVFGNGGTITSDNPIYMCRTDDDDTKTIPDRERYLICCGDNVETDIIKYDNYVAYRYLVMHNMSNKNKKA
jgi:hypothetical protein